MALLTLCVQSCVTPKPVVVPPAPPSVALDSFDLKACDDPVAYNYCNGPGNARFTIAPVGVAQTPRVQIGDANGYVYVPAIPATWTTVTVDIVADGYVPFHATVALADLLSMNGQCDSGECRHNFFPLVSAFPPPPTRAQILASHESFQGSVLHTTQFGDLNWWPAAWISLNPDDRGGSYPQIASWGDTGITVSAAWSYGEPWQPYGDGQIVPNTDYTGNWPAFRASVKDVIRHRSGNGQPFIATVFMEGDNGFNYYMWVMPLIIQALSPQPGDPIDLTQYVRLRMCYDSCVPGWQPPSQVDEAILATRAACPKCVIALEYSTGYPFWGGELAGAAQYNTPAGLALDEVDVEGDTWPVSNWDQYWQVLPRLIGQLYHRPSMQPAADDPNPPCYACNETPRGPRIVHCFEPFTYQWVRGQVDPAQVPVAYQTLSALGCPVIDLPVPR